MSVILRDSRHAATLFGFTGTRLNSGTPRHKFQYFINIRFNGPVRGLDRGDQDQVSALVKTVTMPDLGVNAEVMNQYNRRKIVQTKIEPQNVTMTFHDTVDGLTLKLWQLYYEHYFLDGVNKLGGAGVSMARFPHDVVSPRFEDEFGYNLPNVGNDRHLINAIEIYQVHAGNFNQITAVNPTVSSFSHDTLDYADREGLLEFKLDVMPEAIVYNNINQSLRSLGSDMVDRYRRGDFWGMSDIFSNTSLKPSSRGLDDVSQVASKGSVPQTSGNVAQTQRNTNLSNVEQAVSALRGNTPMSFESPTSTSVFNGKFDSAVASVRTLSSTVNRSASPPVAAASRRPAQASITGDTVITGVRSSDS